MSKMKRFSLLVSLVVFWVVFSGVNLCAGESGDDAPKSRFRWNVTALIDGMESPLGCVGQPVEVRVMNYNTRRPLDHVMVHFYMHGVHEKDVMTGFDGVARYEPVQEGVYDIILERMGYREAKTRFNVSSSCGGINVPASTMPAANGSASNSLTAAQTATTYLTTTSTLPDAVVSVSAHGVSAPSESGSGPGPEVSASAVRSPVLPAASGASCSDGVMNQGEEGVDCGGECGKCPTGERDYVLPLLFASLVLLVAVYFYLNRRKNKGRGARKTGHLRVHKHHRHREA